MVGLRPDEWKPICSSASSTVTFASADTAAAAESPAIPPPITNMSGFILPSLGGRGSRGGCERMGSMPISALLARHQAAPEAPTPGPSLAGRGGSCVQSFVHDLAALA